MFPEDVNLLLDPITELRTHEEEEKTVDSTYNNEEYPQIEYSPDNTMGVDLYVYYL